MTTVFVIFLHVGGIEIMELEKGIYNIAYNKGGGGVVGDIYFFKSYTVNWNTIDKCSSATPHTTHLSSTDLSTVLCNPLLL
jgi:hypothetical protein